MFRGTAFYLQFIVFSVKTVLDLTLWSKILKYWLMLDFHSVLSCHTITSHVHEVVVWFLRCGICSVSGCLLLLSDSIIPLHVNTGLIFLKITDLHCLWINTSVEGCKQAGKDQPSHLCPIWQAALVARSAVVGHLFWIGNRIKFPTQSLYFLGFIWAMCLPIYSAGVMDNVDHCFA